MHVTAAVRHDLCKSGLDSIAGAKLTEAARMMRVATNLNFQRSCLVVPMRATQSSFSQPSTPTPAHGMVLTTATATPLEISTSSDHLQNLPYSANLPDSASAARR